MRRIFVWDFPLRPSSLIRVFEISPFEFAARHAAAVTPHPPPGLS
jgi:hypothetical protein